jgi:hypothetical protein
MSCRAFNVFDGGKRPPKERKNMKERRIYRGQLQNYDKCLFVPSALRGYWSKKYPFSDIDCCNECLDILKVEKFLQDLRIDTDAYKRKCDAILKKEPFGNCADGIPYLFWLSIVFCDIKIASGGKNTSFSGTGCLPYPISKGFDIRDDGVVVFKIDHARTIEEYAEKIARCYFEHDPPDKCDDFHGRYMGHQHYCKCSYDYVPWKKCYKLDDGTIVDGNDLPDHFTLLMDWTKCECKAAEFAKEGGTIVSIDSEKYDNLIGSDYRVSHDDELIKFYSIGTVEKQKAVVTFWPWTFTIGELENNELGRMLDFRVDTRAGKKT